MFLLLFGAIVCDCRYLFIYLFITFYHSQLVHVSVLSGEHTCTTSQHYNAFQCVIVTAMKTHGDKTDLNLSYILARQVSLLLFTEVSTSNTPGLTLCKTLNLNLVNEIAHRTYG